MSQLFGRTLRQAPADAEITSHGLLLRGGFIKSVGAGLYSYLPLGWRVIRRIEAVLRDEMESIGGQEIQMPLVNPAELWAESGRYSSMGPELVRFADRGGRDLVLAMTHEEVVTDLARRELHSYRQLPCMLYQIQTKFRDEARPRGGLIRVREFVMKDAYSFHPDAADLDAYYPQIYGAYVSIFRRLGVGAVPVEADTGAMGGIGSHEFVFPTPVGEDTIVRCPSCGYAANAEKAVSRKDLPERDSLANTGAERGSASAPTLVFTPNTKTIDSLTTFFGVPPQRFLKAVFYSAEPTHPMPGWPEAGARTLVVAAIRGDLEVNVAKLANALSVQDLRLATDDELSRTGVVAGFASPVGLAEKAKQMGFHLRVVLDDSAKDGVFIAGGNRIDHHLRDVVPGRDFQPDLLTDIAVVKDGETCLHCGEKLRAERGIELGHTFKLGTKYSAAMGANYLAADGQQRPLVMGCYGIGPGRLMAAIVEAHNDERGIVWPVSVAPYDVYLLSMGLDDQAVRDEAESLVTFLEEAGLSVLYDDRLESPGVKLNDADLIGIPVRVIVSPRALKAGAFEVKGRAQKQAEHAPREGLIGLIRKLQAGELEATASPIADAGNRHQ